MDRFGAALSRGTDGTCVTLPVPRSTDAAWWHAAFALGASVLAYCPADQAGQTGEVGVRSALLRIGAPRRALPIVSGLTEDEIYGLRDATDVGAGECTEEEKQRIRNAYIPVRAAAWRAEGVSQAVVDRMQRGAYAAVPEPQPARRDYGEYPEQVPGDKWAVAEEMYRCARRGGLEYVTDERGEVHLIHPWIVVHQGKKIRPCQDLSVGLNPAMGPPPPFHLPRVVDVRRWVGRESYFGKLDLADAFWHVPIAPESQK